MKHKKKIGRKEVSQMILYRKCVRKEALRPGCFGIHDYIDKTRQDNVLFGVLYSPMYINFIQII